MGSREIAVVVAGALVLAACSGDDDVAAPPTTVAVADPATTAPPATIAATTAPPTTAAEPEFAYRASIRRTAHNIPHITADSYGSVGYGYGYAFAEDHLCSLADVIVQVRGEAASFFGAGDDDRWVDQDAVYRAMDLYRRAGTDFDGADTQLQDMVRGYAAGYNRYLADTGADAVPGYCAGEPWVRPIDEYDLVAYYKALSWRASVDPLLDYIATAAPPNAGGAGSTSPTSAPAATTSTTVAAATTATPTTTATTTTIATRPNPSLPDNTIDPGVNADRELDTALDATLDAALDALVPDADTLGSNAWAVGPERTANGTTMLVGNPHFPWEGALRFYEVQLTIPGDLNVYGVSLLGTPAVNIGFTDGVAWSHTVSAGKRFTVYTLTLDPADPTRYVYGDETREMTSRTVTVDVLGTNGRVTPVERTIWFSHYGPVLNFPGVGWSDTQVLTVRDANADNDELIPQFAAMNRAQSMDELITAHADNQGIPWVNTVAASADGRIWYADTSSSPNLSDAAIAQWEAAVAEGGLVRIALDNGVIVLDGSDPVNEWVDAPGARDAGLVPFDDMPQLERDDYVFNANDPYWVANPAELLGGFSPVHGLDDTPLSPRTRMNARQLDSVTGDAGDDGLFTREELRDSSIGNRVFTAELLVDEVVTRCRTEIDEQAICDVLANWDRRNDVDSVGPALWRTFLDQFDFADVLDAGTLWKNPFDPADPLATPSGLSDSPAVVANLQAAADALRVNGFDIDTPLGDVQYAVRGDVRVPIHGGLGIEGISNVVAPGRNTTTTEPGPGTAGATDVEWPVANGTSFIYNVEFTVDGPVAEAFLTYGESGDPASPFFSDQTRLFSAKQWRPILFTDDAITADPDLREYEIAE
jgi:acyl-homoserine-lactone acylase